MRYKMAFGLMLASSVWAESAPVTLKLPNYDLSSKQSGVVEHYSEALMKLGFVQVGFQENRAMGLFGMHRLWVDSTFDRWVALRVGVNASTEGAGKSASGRFQYQVKNDAKLGAAVLWIEPDGFPSVVSELEKALSQRGSRSFFSNAHAQEQSPYTAAEPKTDEHWIKDFGKDYAAPPSFTAIPKSVGGGKGPDALERGLWKVFVELHNSEKRIPSCLTEALSGLRDSVNPAAFLETLKSLGDAGVEMYNFYCKPPNGQIWPPARCAEALMKLTSQGGPAALISDYIGRRLPTWSKGLAQMFRGLETQIPGIVLGLVEEINSNPRQVADTVVNFCCNMVGQFSLDIILTLLSEGMAAPKLLASIITKLPKLARVFEIVTKFSKLAIGKSGDLGRSFMKWLLRNGVDPSRAAQLESRITGLLSRFKFGGAKSLKAALTECALGGASAIARPRGYDITSSMPKGAGGGSQCTVMADLMSGLERALQGKKYTSSESSTGKHFLNNWKEFQGGDARSKISDLVKKMRPGDPGKYVLDPAEVRSREQTIIDALQNKAKLSATDCVAGKENGGTTFLWCRAEKVIGVSLYNKVAEPTRWMRIEMRTNGSSVAVHSHPVCSGEVGRRIKDLGLNPRHFGIDRW